MLLNTFLKLSLLIFGFCQSVYGQARIINGTVTNVQACPSCVYIADKSGKLLCGAALIHTRFVASAASCTKPHIAGAMNVHGGKTYQLEAGEVIPVIKMIYSINFDQTTYDWDISLAQLQNAFTSTLAVPAPINSNPLEPYQVLRFYGWGEISEGGKVSNVLRTMQVSVMTPASCEEYLTPQTARQFCTNSVYVGACDRDQGGGYYDKDGQWCGVDIWSYGCGRGYPNLGTRASEINTFIQRAITNNL